MHRKKLIPLLFLALATPALALSEAGKTAGEELIASIKEELKEINDPLDDRRGYSSTQYIRQLQAALDKGNNPQIEQILENYSASVNSAKISAIVTKLRDTMKAERDDKVKAIIAKMEAQLQKASQTVLEAKTPADLDGLIEQLSRNTSNGYSDESQYDSPNSKIQRLTQQISYAKQFVTGWQNYLQAKKIGDKQQASSALQSISSQENSLIPRSQILDRIQEEKGGPSKMNEDQISTLLEGIKSLDDMRGFLKNLGRLQRNSSSDMNTQALYDYTQTISRLEKIYREYLAGLPSYVEVLSQSSEYGGASGKSEIIRLRADLIMLVLPRYLDIPDTKANAGESVDDFLNRLRNDAKDRGDLAACQRIASARQLISRGSRYNNEDTVGIRDYTAGQNQLAAGQYMLAVISLQTALKSGSDTLPNEKIGEQLSVIQKEHAKDYELGMKEFLTPRVSPDFPHGTFPYRGSYQDPRSPVTGPSLVLPIPGKASDAKTPATPEPDKKTSEAPAKPQAPKEATPATKTEEPQPAEKAASE